MLYNMATLFISILREGSETTQVHLKRLYIKYIPCTYIYTYIHTHTIKANIYALSIIHVY